MEHQQISDLYEQQDQDNTQEQPTPGAQPDEDVRDEAHQAVQMPDTQTEHAPSVKQEAHASNSQVEEGIRQHGDAFRAYLELPDIDLNRDDLLQTFREFYIGTFASMDALLNELTEIRDCMAAITEVAASWGFDDMAGLDPASVERVARETWDIVEISGNLYAFDK
ncbi:MAG: hypothetical protein ACRDTE_10915 [Pseudonocardiaceae bacterium]